MIENAAYQQLSIAQEKYGIYEISQSLGLHFGTVKMKKLNKKQAETAFRRIMTTRPSNKIGRDEVSKPDGENTIYTRYRIVPK